VRSCVSEFSGFLLFKELSRQLQKAHRPGGHLILEAYTPRQLAQTVGWKPT